MHYYQVHKNYFPKAKQLRKEFDSYFENPRSTNSQRFVWDYWFINDQYNAVRTPAMYYFSKKIYTEFHSYLVQWGRENLGCHDISPPWLSYYVDGCFQNMHSDVPHGPWAFVYSLTKDIKKFQGGETFILKPNVLNYWPQFQDNEDRELSSFIQKIPSPFNQLTVFDPRFPHGVTEVKGTRDPMESRLVIHGWFVEPRPYVVGGLSTAKVQKTIDPIFYHLNDLLTQLDPVHGTLSFRLQISKNGTVKNFKGLTNTIIPIHHDSNSDRILYKELKTLFSNLKFSPAKTDSLITIPLMFK